MGTMAFTRAAAGLADEAEGVYEGYRVVRGTIAFSTSYATGGDLIPMASVGLQEIRKVLIDPSLIPGFGYLAGVSVNLGGTPSAPTLAGFDALNTELTAGTNNSTRVIPVWFLGSG